MNLEGTPSPDNWALSISVVVYRSGPQRLIQTLRSLAAACRAAREADKVHRVALFLVDNGGMPALTETLQELSAHGLECTIIGGQGNVGYGRGHNLAIERAASRYHLVLNPDIDLDQMALARAFEFFDAHPQAGLLTPRITDEQGSLQYLCRRYPTVPDLLIRGFAPASIRRRFAGRLARYEMRDLVNDHDIVWDPPIASGCFMLFRTEVLKQLGGFDPRYFLYFEDYDLSLRVPRISRIVYVPMVQVCHHGGGAARKGFTHIRLFAASAWRFFNRFGWKWQ